MLCSFIPLESYIHDDRNVERRRSFKRTKAKASPFLTGFTTRFHNFIWFLIFTFTLYCIPNYELLLNYELHFDVSEAEAAEGGASASGAAGGDTGPSVSFSVDDFSGAAHLSYPIAVPPARGGLAPQLSLGYNSSGGNGWIGVGWDLSVGCIQRRGPRRGLPKYDDTKDIYELNIGGAPQELVPVGGDEYRLKIEGAFLKINYYSYGNYWEVLDKSGNKIRFGSTVNSRIGRVRDPNVKNETYRWYSDRVEDPKTNYMEITYFRDQDANQTYQIYPQEMKYNGQVAGGLAHNHTILFTLESSDRPDPIYSYRMGFKSLTRKRLSSIEVSTNNNLVRRYQLQYTVSNARSLLSSVTLYGSDNTSSPPPTTFSYQTHASGFQTAVGWPDPNGTQIRDDYWGHGTASDVIDINGDGLVERVVGGNSNGTWNVYHNNLQGFDAQPWSWFNPTSGIDSVQGYLNYIRNTQPGSGTYTDVIDMNGDGLPDRVVDAGGPNNEWLVYLNDGVGGFGQGSPWPNSSGLIRSSLRYKTWAFTSVDVVDMNGDGLPDRITSDGTTWYVSLNNGAGFDPTVVWPNATGYIRNTYSYKKFTFTNGDLIDMNGDGLPDRVISDGTTWWVSLNNGAGFDAPMVWPGAAGYIRTSYNTTIGDDPGDPVSETSSDLIDMNGDGLPDLVIYNGTSPWTVCLNNGSGFGPCVAWSNSGNVIRFENQVLGTDVDVFDINGDGLVDWVWYVGGYSWSVALNSGPVPDLLSKVVNSMGGSTEITYRPSTAYDNTGDDGKAHLPYIVQTVSSYVQKDGRGNSYTSRYDYAHGFYDPVTIEFRGFRNVTTYQMFDSQTYESKTETEYFQDYYLKGKVKNQKFTSKEGHTKQIVNNWLLADTLGGGKFPYLDTATTTVTDQGQGGPFTFSQTTKDVYDIRPSDLTHQTFNLLEEHKNEGSPEEIVTRLEYTADYNRRILSKITKATVTDSSGAIASRKWMDYNAVGDLITEEVCKSSNPNTGCLSRNATQNIVTSYQYDPTYKLLTQVTDPRGYLTTITYDSTKMYVYETTKCIEGGKCFKTTIEYDAGTGNLTKSIPPHLQGTPYWLQTQYDVFGRKTLDRMKDNSYPNGPPIVDRGSTSYFYNDSGNANTQYVLKIGRIVVEGAPQRTLTLNGYSYFDGMGRTYSAATNGPDGKTITIDTQFDNIGRVWRQSKPYFYGTETPYYAETTYDGLSRATNVKKLDGYYIHTDYEGLTKIISKQVTATDWQSNAYTYDRNQKLIQVIEALGVEGKETPTTYKYDTLGNLIQVIAAVGKPEQNITTISYDSLMKKTAMNDPDMGSWTYEYDKMGNLIKQTDAKNQVIIFNYDGMNRLTEKIYPDHTVTFTYDDPLVPYSWGKLTKISDPSGGELKEDLILGYDLMQRITKSQKTIGAQSVTFQKSYDSAGRIVSVTYPGGKTYSYEYDATGDLLYVKDNATGNHLVEYSDFTALGQQQIASFPKPNNVSVMSAYAYDPATSRLRTLVTQKLMGGVSAETFQDLDYQQFDGNGSIITLADNKNGITHNFAYDPLNRLIAASGNNGIAYNQNYQYDRIGNITYKSDFGTYTYDYSNKPHAVKSVATDRTVPSDSGLVITYNLDNRPDLIKKNGSNYVQFTYDGNGQRVKKQNFSTGQTTLYFGGLYEVRGGVGIIHVFAGSQRVASVFPDGRTQFYHSNHLGSSSFITDQNGDKKEKIEYFPFGEYRAVGDPNGTIDYDPNFPDVYYTFTGQEDDDDLGLYNYGARLYDPVLGRFISPDTVVQAPDDPQTLNRYSYARNNPLIYTDPSGNLFIIDDIIGAVITAVIGALTSIGVPSAVASIIVYAACGAALGAIESAIMGGDVGLGALTGAISGALFFGVGEYVVPAVNGALGATTPLARALVTVGVHTAAGAVSGAINSAITGGDIGMGALTGAVGAGIGAATGGGLKLLGVKQFGYQFVARIVMGGVAGGVVSSIYGGNFWQGFGMGAGTAAAAFLFNDSAKGHGEKGSEKTEEPAKAETPVVPLYCTSLLGENARGVACDLLVALGEGTYATMQGGLALVSFLGGFSEPELWLITIPSSAQAVFFGYDAFDRFEHAIKVGESLEKPK